MSRLAGLGGSTARQTAQAGQWKYSIPWTLRSIYESGLAGGRKAIGSSCFCEFESSLVQEFEPFQEFHDFGVPQLLLRDWLQISCQVTRKIVLYIIYFVYSLLSLVVGVVAVVVFLLLSC